MCLLLWSQPLPALTERTLWIFESLNAHQTFTPLPQKRHLATFGAHQHRNAISTEVSATADLSLFEFRALYSRRLFLSSQNTQDQFARSFLNLRRHTFGGEISRYAISSSSHFGRLALGFLNSFPDDSYRWITINTQAGVLQTTTFPWSLSVNIGMLFPIHVDVKILRIGLSASHVFHRSKALAFMVGGLTDVSLKLFSSQPGPLGLYEHLLISFGPKIGLVGKQTELVLAATWRLWIDKEITATRPRQPSQIEPLPDFGIKWSLMF